MVSNEEAIENISISGDFLTQPYKGAIEKLENSLIGIKVEKNELANKINDIFKAIGVVVFGASQDDFVEAI